ncbi:unnamed protein product [Camellia sinensis]
MFSYVIHVKKYIENLTIQVETLEALQNGVQRSIDHAKRNREEIREDVNHWITKVDGFIVEAKKFLEGGSNVNKKCFSGWFPDLVTRRRLGKEAKNKIEEAKELGKDGNFTSLSNPAAPLGIESIPSEGFETYDSRNLAITNVMEALSNDKINFIGIHGIGGVGKTTLVKEIGKQAKSDNLFDDVVMVVVSHNPDIKKIQDEIAGMLGFTRLTDQRSEIERASMLCGRLKDVKKILVILDDVWAKLNLAAAGIPFGNDHQGCKIIITTRREQICNSMGMERLRTKIVHLGVLSKKDSWDLFKKNVGDVVDSNELNIVANEVCKECGGLPIALVTVGSAMKGKDDPNLWKEAARELGKSMPTNIEGVDQQVYKSLRLSYDYLQDEEAKACFLLCSLFPEDHDILVEDLVRYGMGLRLFKNVDTVQEVRGRAKSVISNLIDSCLLLASDEQDRIKMHDVVRDVAIFIGSKKHFVRAGCNLKDWPNMDSLDQYTSISLMRNQISNLPEVLECPKLQILLFQYNENEWSCSHEFFSRMNALSVLDLSQQGYYGYDNPIQSPDAFNDPTCLRTLVLDGIRFEDTKFLGQLKTLEVLSLRRAFFFEAPNAIRELTNLRLLDMTESCHEFPIPATMVLPLFHLEELYLFGITSWSIGYLAVEVVAALRSLHRLKMLTISVPDIAYIPKDFVFPELESFIIFIGKSGFYGGYKDCSPNYLGLGNLVGTMVNWSKWLKMVLNRATHLRIEDCSELEYLINTEEWGISSQAQPRDLQFPFNLEELELYHLDSFKGICAASALTTSSWVYFPKLRSLTVNTCPSLSTVLLPFNLLQRLQHLEKLFVIECVKLEQVFDFDSEGEGMKLLSSLNCSSRQHVQLCNLRYLRVQSCGKLKYVFQPSIAQALHQLEELCVRDCEEMEEIVAAKQNEGQQQEEERVDYKMVFKSLKELRLVGLPNLSGFCTGGDDFPFEWPSLERLDVIKCPKMKTFVATTFGSTPKLKEVNLDGQCIPLHGMDLNQFVQTHFIAMPPKLESIPLMVQGVWSEDPAVQIEATTQFRKLLSIECSPPIDEVIKAGVVPRFVEFLGRQDLPQLQFEAAWALTNVACGTLEHTRVVIEYGAVPKFVLLLSSASDDVREQAVWALGNVAGDSPSCRDLVLGNGALMPLLAQLNEHSKLSMLRNATWTLSNFLRGKPPTPFEQVKPALPVLRQLIHLNDEEVLTNACWALSYLSDAPNDKIQAVIEAGVCPRLVELLLHPSPTVLRPALRTVGNIVTGDDTQIQFVIENHVLPCLYQLLTQNHKNSIKKEACWTISNITAGNRSQIQAVIEANIILPLVHLLQHAEFEIKKEAAQAITNATFGGSHDQIRFLASQGCIKPLCDLLICPDPRIVAVCLKGLENILKVGEADKEGGMNNGINLYAQTIDESDGLDKIENLQTHDNNEIHEKAVKILEILHRGG